MIMDTLTQQGRHRQVLDEVKEVAFQLRCELAQLLGLMEGTPSEPAAYTMACSARDSILRTAKEVERLTNVSEAAIREYKKLKKENDGEAA